MLRGVATEPVSNVVTGRAGTFVALPVEGDDAMLSFDAGGLPAHGASTSDEARLV